MSEWEIEYYSDSGKSLVEIWLDNLTTEQLKSVAKELKLLALCGNQLKLPHSKALGKGLFELRERRYGYRIYYTFIKSKIILLQAGDKSTQRNDIIKAQKRITNLE